MRGEAVDMSEFTRRLEEQILRTVEFERPLAWTERYCKEGKEYNLPEKAHRRKKKNSWEPRLK